MEREAAMDVTIHPLQLLSRSTAFAYLTQKDGTMRVGVLQFRLTTPTKKD